MCSSDLWSAPVSNGGATVSSYTAQRSIDGGVTWTTRATGLTASPYVDSGLTNGTTYVYRVIANNVAGAGAPSAGVAAVPAAKPGAPTALVATGASGSAVLSWTPPVDTGGTAILGYRIEMSIDTGSTQLDANGNTVDADPWTVVVANSGDAGAIFFNLTIGETQALPDLLEFLPCILHHEVFDRPWSQNGVRGTMP